MFSALIIPQNRRQVNEQQVKNQLQTKKETETAFPSLDIWVN